MKPKKRQKRPTFREIPDNSPFIQLHAGEAVAAFGLIVPAFVGLLIHGIINALH